MFLCLNQMNSIMTVLALNSIENVVQESSIDMMSRRSIWCVFRLSWLKFWMKHSHHQCHFLKRDLVFSRKMSPRKAGHSPSYPSKCQFGSVTQKQCSVCWYNLKRYIAIVIKHVFRGKNHIKFQVIRSFKKTKVVLEFSIKWAIKRDWLP